MRHKEKLFELLRAAAESPRESAAVEDLARKINYIMPPIENVDANHKKFDGVIYRRDDRIGRYTAEITLHRAVWHYFNGEIPRGYNVHHIDFDINFFSRLRHLSSPPSHEQ